MPARKRNPEEKRLRVTVYLDPEPLELLKRWERAYSPNHDLSSVLRVAVALGLAALDADPSPLGMRPTTRVLSGPQPPAPAPRGSTSKMQEAGIDTQGSKASLTQVRERLAAEAANKPPPRVEAPEEQTLPPGPAKKRKP